MRIDAHMHVNFRNIRAHHIIEYLDDNDFDCCWLMTWEEKNHGKWHYEHLCIEDVYETYLKYPSRIIPMYAPDPNGDAAAEVLMKWYRNGIRGCAELKTTLNWESDRLKNLLSLVCDLKMPLVFHMEDPWAEMENLESDGALEVVLMKLIKSRGSLGLPGKLLNAIARYCRPLSAWKQRRLIFPGYMLDFASLGKILEEYPSINFIGHGPLFWKHLREAPRKKRWKYSGSNSQAQGLTYCFLRDYPNLYADISAPSGYFALDKDHGFSKNFLSEFSHKLLYGTDNFNMGHEKLLKSIDPGPEILNRILGENAWSLLMQPPACSHDLALNSCP